MENKSNFKVRNNLHVLYIYFVFVIKQFFTSPISVFLGFGAITIILNMWLLVHGVDNLVVPSCLCVGISRCAGQIFFLQLKHFKDSGLNKRMRFMANSTMVYMGYVAANFVISLSIVAWILLGSSLYSYERVLMKETNWSMLFLCLFLLWLLFISIDLFFYTYTKNTLYTYCLIIAFYIISIYFLGCAYPYYIVHQYKVIDTIMYFFPPRYLFNAAQASWVNQLNLVYTFSNGTKNITIDYGLWHNILYPILISVAFIIIFISAIFIKKSISNSIIKKNHIIFNSIKNIKNEYNQMIVKATSKEQVEMIHNEFLDSISK